MWKNECEGGLWEVFVNTIWCTWWTCRWQTVECFAARWTLSTTWGPSQNTPPQIPTWDIPATQRQDPICCLDRLVLCSAWTKKSSCFVTAGPWPRRLSTSLQITIANHCVQGKGKVIRETRVDDWKYEQRERVCDKSIYLILRFNNVTENIAVVIIFIWYNTWNTGADNIFMEKYCKEFCTV